MANEKRERVPLKGGFDHGGGLGDLQIVAIQRTVVQEEQTLLAPATPVTDTEHPRIETSSPAKPKRSTRVTKFEQTRNNLLAHLLIAEGAGLCGVSPDLKEALAKASTSRERYTALREVIVAASSQLSIEHSGLPGPLAAEEEVADDKIQSLINKHLCPATEKVVTAVEILKSQREKQSQVRGNPGGTPPAQQSNPERERRPEPLSKDELVRKIVRQQNRLKRYYLRNATAQAETSAFKQQHRSEDLRSWSEDQLTAYSRQLGLEIGAVCPPPSPAEIEEFRTLRDKYPQRMSEDQRTASVEELRRFARHELATILRNLRMHDQSQRGDQGARRETREQRQRTHGRQTASGNVVLRTALPTTPAAVVPGTTRREQRNSEQETPTVTQTARISQEEIDRLKAVDHEFTTLKAQLDAARAVVNASTTGKDAVPFSELIVQLARERDEARASASQAAQQHKTMLDEFRNVAGVDYSLDVLQQMKAEALAAQHHKEASDNSEALLKETRKKRNLWKIGCCITSILAAVCFFYILVIWTIAWKNGSVTF